ncbi:MAG: 50S ribosomal protein L13 [Candidatus Harrisonbacteria bacterium]|nr:50S ribosomal protein L13 [Candidatus Harrisonbacteria bacterium]
MKASESRKVNRDATEYIFDAEGKILGRLATEISVILQGKHKASYEPRLAGTDRVVVKNASKIKVTGRKMTDKIYYRQRSQRPGGLKATSLAELLKKKPTEAVYNAVFNMLPKNRLRQKRMNRLTIEA